MRISFDASAQSSLGVEWELAVIDTATLEQVPGAHLVLAEVDDPTGGPVRGEFLDSMLELVTGVHGSVADAVAELGSLHHRVSMNLERHGLAPLGVGTHPFGDPAQQAFVHKAQYRRVQERNGWWGRQLAINGLHIHAGLSHRDKAMPVTRGLAQHVPHFIALTASSPFWHGVDTGFASQRTMLFQQLPTNGLPWDFEDWNQFESYATQLEGVGLIHSPAEIRWDVRPTPFGTVENRLMDSVPTLFEVGAVTALAQCLVESLSQRLEAGKTIAALPPWFLKENKWRAARYGLEAELITGRPDQHTVLLRDDMHRLVDELEPVAAQLGCQQQLHDVADLVDGGPSYARQRRVATTHGGDARQVMAALLRESSHGVPERTR